MADWMSDQDRLDYEFEFYETPHPFTAWLAVELASLGVHDMGTVCEPMVGNGAIVDSLREMARVIKIHHVITNDLDGRREADMHQDATTRETWNRLRELAGVDGIDWTVTNPHFTGALEVAEQALRCSNAGVALHVRSTLNEPLRTPGLGRSFLRAHPPTLTLWLPRFAYRRSRTTGKWSTDSATCCWLVWMPVLGQWRDVRYAPDWVIDHSQELQAARTGRERRVVTGGRR